MTDYSANGHFEYGVFFKGGAIPWVATITPEDANIVAERLGSEYEVRPL